MTLPHLFASFSLTDLGLLTEERISEALTISRLRAKPAVLRGGSTTSLEAEGVELSYRLMMGDDVDRYLPWLGELYRGRLLDLATQVAGEPMNVSDEVRNGANLNVLEGKGARYEWHVDSNPLTGLIFFTRVTAQGGGRLIFGDPSSDKTYLEADPGTFLLFDARRAPHAVEPLLSDEPRVSAPFNFFCASGQGDRPNDLDDYLYG